MNLIKTFDRLVLTPIEKRMRAEGKIPRWLRKPALSQTVSIIVPCFNVGQYIDEFFASLFSQSTGLANIEIIMVDDGSSDNTAERIAAWSAKKPDTVKYVRQENAGAAAARNAGVALASGKWLTFPDPDDFLHHHYFHHINSIFKRGRAQRLDMVVCNLLVYQEATKSIRNSHGLSYRFKANETWLPISDMQNFVQMSAAHALYRREVIQSCDLKFDGRIKPRFEDANFVNRYLSRCLGGCAVFSRAPKYYYRKRADQSSIMDTARSKREFYTNQPSFGWLGLLGDVISKHRYIPEFVQRAILYDTTGHLRVITEQPHMLADLTAQEQEELFANLQRTFSYLDTEIIKDFSLSSFHEEIKVGALNLFKSRSHDRTIFYVKDHDLDAGRLKILFFSEHSENDAVVTVNGERVQLHHPKTISTSLLSRPFYHEHSFWVEFTQGRMKINRPGNASLFRLPARRLAEEISHRDIIQTFTHPLTLRLPQALRTMRNHALSEASRVNFKDCWVLMDRADKADDNAEAFYRYLMSERPEVNAYFVLQRRSRDWKRLASDGFKLLDFQSRQHFAAMAHAQFLLSSHGDRFIAKPFPQKELTDLQTFKFVFLQHGIILHDQSAWFNDMMPRMLVTSTQSEYQSVVGEGSRYRITDREVKLTGLARHDRLLALDRENSKDIIFIMPTWRENLTIVQGKDKTRVPIPGFENSIFVDQWHNLLNSVELKRIASETGKTVVFCPHPNFGRHANRFSPPSWVTTISAVDIESLQPFFARASVLVTDYSSVAFDVAFLNHPVVYFQFDRDDFYKGHIYQTGYFDFYQHGFGPVTADVGTTTLAIETAIRGAEPTEYSDRRIRTFAFRDGKNCERIYDQIRSIGAGFT